MTGDRVLFVCAGNVCRSPYMSLRLESALAELGLRDFGVVTDSRGADVGSPAPMCRFASGHLHPSHADAAGAHTAKSLRGDDVASADLILTASRADRAAVALARPDARGRTFTLLEAVLLGERGVRPSELRALAVDESSPLRAYARLLHERRGTLPTPVGRLPRALGGWRDAPSPDLDVPDRHSGNHLAHLRLFKKLDGEIATLAGDLRVVFDEAS